MAVSHMADGQTWLLLLGYCSLRYCSLGHCSLGDAIAGPHNLDRSPGVFRVNQSTGPPFSRHTERNQPMTDERIAGTAQNIAGKVQGGIGHATGDAKMEVE